MLGRELRGLRLTQVRLRIGALSDALRATTARRLCLLICLCLAACAATPVVHTDQDPHADLSKYRTFAFFEPLTTDSKGYSTLLSTRLRAATSRELEARGYRYEPAHPDLLVNFNVNLKERDELRALPNPTLYDYRVGLYNLWPDYPYDIYTVHYTEGILIIDLVDAAAKQLVWQGLASGTVNEKVLKDPARTIDRTVANIFSRFPVPKKY